MALVEMLVNGLLGRLVDNSHVVRKLCIRGLGNVASNGPEQVGYSAWITITFFKLDLNSSILLDIIHHSHMSQY